MTDGVLIVVDDGATLRRMVTSGSERGAATIEAIGATRSTLTVAAVSDVLLRDSEPSGAVHASEASPSRDAQHVPAGPFAES